MKKRKEKRFIVKIEYVDGKNKYLDNVIKLFPANHHIIIYYDDSVPYVNVKSIDQTPK